MHDFNLWSSQVYTPQVYIYTVLVYYIFTQNDCVGEVRPFTRGQACLVHSFLDQIDHMGTSRERLNRLLDYLELSVSPGRMPSGDIISQLWSVTTDISVCNTHTHTHTHTHSHS